MIIWLSGPTGAGKTSLARLLRQTGYSIVEEHAPEELFRAFASDPTANCETLQRYLMQARFDGWRRVSNATRIAFDRSIDEDIEVFCKMHRHIGLLTQGQFDALAQLGRNLQVQIPTPDLIVFVTAEPHVLLRRIRSPATAYPIIDNLEDQISLYTKWLQNRTEEMLKLDTTRLSERMMARVFSEVQSC